jgi:5'-AMP-activated protein kinase regulatory beta subunit
LEMPKNGKKLNREASAKSVFVCHSDSAQNVFVAGTFNDWDPTCTQTEPQGDGTWRVELELAPGRYEYKFVVDGAWCCEPGVPETDGAGDVPNPYGSMNRVIDIPATAQAKASTGH